MINLSDFTIPIFSHEIELISHIFIIFFSFLGVAEKIIVDLFSPNKGTSQVSIGRSISAPIFPKAQHSEIATAKPPLEQS